MPLVLHGGSGTPDDQVQQAVRNGICKLNIYADCRIAMRRGLERGGRDRSTGRTRCPTRSSARSQRAIAGGGAAEDRELSAEGRAPRLAH